jgi:hypothetical protein
VTRGVCAEACGIKENWLRLKIAKSAIKYFFIMLGLLGKN